MLHWPGNIERVGGWGCESRIIECLKWGKSAGWGGRGKDGAEGCVAIGVSAVQTPLGVQLVGLEVGLEQAGEGCLGEEGSSRRRPGFLGERAQYEGMSRWSPELDGLVGCFNFQHAKNSSHRIQGTA